MSADDHPALTRELSWVWREVLTRRRRSQGLMVFALMLLGGFAEILTLGAVVPLLAIFAGAGSQPNSRIAEFLSRIGIDPGALSLTTVGAAFCVFAVVTAIIRISLAWAGQKYVFRVGYDIGVALYDRMLHQPFKFHVGTNSSRIIAGMESIQKLLTGMLMPMLQAAIAIVVGSFLVAGLILLSPFATLFALTGFAAIYATLSVVTRGRLRRNAEIIANMNRMRVQTVQEGLGGIRDVLLDNTQSVYVGKFRTIDAQLRHAQGANALIAVAPRFLAEATGIVLLVALALLLHSEQGGVAASLPILGALALGAQRLLPMIQQAYSGWANSLSAQGMLFAITGLLRQPLPIVTNDVALAPFESALELEAMGFAYDGDKDRTIKDVSLRIAKGARVGFVGKSGSGKTTLLNLIMGLLEPSSGQIKIDGQSLGQANLASWQQQVAHVPQSIFLIDGPIAHNIAFGVAPDEIDEERLRHASRLADIAEFIDSLPHGYSTLVGERGVRLSGGQIQRIGLARALYKQASVLILDEATSALDDATEANIIDAVERLGRDYTILMIAHRTTTLRRCDTIFRLDCGMLVESGPPGAVLASGVKPFSASPRAARSAS